MLTQRDQIRAYQFLRRRLVSALVSADANYPVSPSKRLVLGTGLGFAASLLVAVVFGINGLLTPSRAEEWRRGARRAAAGIAGAPDSLPGNDRLLAGPRCTRLSPDRPADDEPIPTVLLGHDPDGWELSEGQAILARLPYGELFLLAGGMRHRLVDGAAMVALGYASVDSITVAPQWLNTIGRPGVPAPVLALGPTGPTLDPVQARRTAGR